MPSLVLRNHARGSIRLIDRNPRLISNNVANDRRMLHLRPRAHSSFEGRRLISTTRTSTFSSSSAQKEGENDDQKSRIETDITTDGICHVILNRPEKLNALDLRMFEAIAETASNLRNDRTIRAVILRGKGRAFCTGLDVVRNSIIDLR